MSLCAAVVIVTARSGGKSPRGGSLPAAITTRASGAKRRPVYKHSVVRGGVYSAVETQTVAAKDDVVREHYRGIRMDRLKVVHAERAQARFMSYRRGNKVFWTSRRVSVPAGEALLTDGYAFIRARCGNRIDEVRHLPVMDGAKAPDLAELDQTEETGETSLASLKIESPKFDTAPSALALLEGSDAVAMPYAAAGEEVAEMMSGLSSGPGGVGYAGSPRKDEGSLTPESLLAEFRYPQAVELWPGMALQSPVPSVPSLLLSSDPTSPGSPVTGSPTTEASEAASENSGGSGAISEALTDTPAERPIGQPGSGSNSTLDLVQLSEESRDGTNGDRTESETGNSSAVPEPGSLQMAAVALAALTGAVIWRRVRSSIV